MSKQIKGGGAYTKSLASLLRIYKSFGAAGEEGLVIGATHPYIEDNLIKTTGLSKAQIEPFVSALLFMGVVVRMTRYKSETARYRLSDSHLEEWQLKFGKRKPRPRTKQAKHQEA